MLLKLPIFAAIRLGIFFAVALAMIVSQTRSKMKNGAQIADLKVIKNDLAQANPLPRRGVRDVRDEPQGQMATTAHCWRLNQSLAPRRDWLGEIAQLPEFRLIAGEKDEAFDAALSEQTLPPANPKGRYEIVPGVGHLGIVDAPQIRAFLR